MRSIAWFLLAQAFWVSTALADGRTAPRKSSQGTSEFGLFAEPFLGYGFGSYNGGSSGNVASPSYTLIGPSFGGQFGAVYRSYFLAARFEYQLLSNSQLTQNPKDLEVGVVIGVTLSSAPVRFWAGFNFVDNLNTGGQTLSSNSFLLGIGYFFAKFSVNAEYHFRTYAVYNVLGQSIQPSYSNGVLTLSMPLTFSTPSMPELARKNQSTQKDASSVLGDDWNI